MGRLRRRPCLAGSVFVLAVLGTACADAGDAERGDGAPVDERQSSGSVERQATGSVDRASAQAVLASQDLLMALSDERNAAALGILGLETAVALPTDTREARRVTDEALAGFQTTVAGLADDVGAAYQPAFDAAADLNSLRGEIEGHRGPPAVSEIEHADGVSDRYGEVIDLLIDADRTVTVSIEDPDLRRGAELFTTGLQQNELTGRAVQAVTLGVVSGGLNAPDQIAEVAALHGMLAQGRATVTETAAGSDFAAAADQLEADLTAAGFLDSLSSILETGQADVPAVLDAVPASADQGWFGFLTRVEEILRDILA
jgi:hypothetical protein